MIFLVPDTVPPFGNRPMRFKCTSLILDDYTSSFPWNHLNGTSKFTILHKVDDSCVQMFMLLFHDHLPYCIVLAVVGVP